MATFPAIEPAARRYDLGVFPLTEQPSLSAGIVRFRHSELLTNYNLELEYVCISDAQAAEIRTHFQGQGGTYRSFQLPAEIWGGHTFSGNVFPVGTRWRYAEAPEETHHEIGRYSMTISLVSDGIYEGLAIDPVAVTMVTGAAVGQVAGLAVTVTASLSAGAATGV